MRSLRRVVAVLLALAAAGVWPASSQSEDAQVRALFYMYIPGDAALPLELHVAQGQGLEFTNFDLDVHSLTADEQVDGVPLFDSTLVGTNRPSPVARVETIPTGAYTFHCTRHPEMHGTLIVDAPAG